MKKLLIAGVAVAGLSVFAMSGSAEAGHHYYAPAPVYGAPVYRAPVYGIPAYRAPVYAPVPVRGPVVAPVRHRHPGHYHHHGRPPRGGFYGAPGFGIYTPGFGLYVR